MNAKQVVVIGGGDAYPDYETYFAHLANAKIESAEYFKPHADWKASLQDSLGADYDVLIPSMPNKQNARFTEWSIWFGKVVPFLRENAVLVAHSLGGIFIARYLCENTLPVRLRGICLVAAPYDDESRESLGDFALPSSLDSFAAQTQRIALYYSENDPVVPFIELAKYRSALPSAVARIFSDRGHFNQETFPELVADVKGF